MRQGLQIGTIGRLLVAGVALVTIVGTASATDIRLNVGQSLVVSVTASNQWNITNIRMKADEVYVFSTSSSDTWKNGLCAPCNAGGHTTSGCTSDAIAGLGLEPPLLAAEGLRRAKGERWLCLMGELFDQATGNLGGLLAKVQFKIGSSRTFTVPTSGSLVLFANDQLGKGYEDNSGLVKVTIKRTK